MATGVIEKVKELHFGTRTAISASFIVPNDGIVEIQLRAAASGRLYASYDTSFKAFIDGYTIKDSYIIATFPIHKGEAISSPSSQMNISGFTFYYTPLEY